MNGQCSSLAKRIVDIAVAGVALLALCPAMFFIALVVRLSSPGPVLFRQLRLGRGGRPFTLLKFRTMRNGAPDLRNADGSAYTGAGDARVTPVGRILRAASLDELPQLFCVLAGTMSLVGPRPDQVDQLQFYSERDLLKLSVKPGLTGLAQIGGRNRISWERRKALDVEYVERQSLWLDLSILLRTIPYVAFGKDIHEGASRRECAR
jgi:lipopolysaccharide/colanic/teichoic acid biosynthesis glycosyltransferase